MGFPHNLTITLCILRRAKETSNPLAFLMLTNSSMLCSNSILTQTSSNNAQVDIDKNAARLEAYQVCL